MTAQAVERHERRNVLVHVGLAAHHGKGSDTTELMDPGCPRKGKHDHQLSHGRLASSCWRRLLWFPTRQSCATWELTMNRLPSPMTRLTRSLPWRDEK